ncbi:hypothetical protein ACJMK2_036925 [Sinanodonta woodiana]|uniref:Uncharacterized protein n=1 Tax=Sinanodonta woodiana TaxID=1069815 RepID=A0ABD3WK23_SINWO
MKTCTVFAVFLMLGTASCGIPTNEATVAVNLGNGTTSSPNTTTDALTSDPSNSTSKTSVQPIKKLGEEGDERRHSSKSPNQRDSHTKKIHVEERENSTRSSTTDQNQTANSTRKDNDEGDRGRRRSSITTPTSTVFTVSKVG